MRKPASQKHQAVQKLKTIIRLSKKAARQINRKLEALAQLNKAKQHAKEELIKIWGQNEKAKAS